MNRKAIVLILIVLSGLTEVFSQVSPDCVNAIPICNNTPINGGTTGFGIDDFNGATVTGCIAQASGTIESNSAWYRFRTGENGQLGINIGFDVSEDWDFALYRTDDCGSLGDPVRCNYFDNSDDNTYTGFGVDPTGADNFQYDDYLQVSPGEEYYLFINNFSNNNSGFSIQFSGSIFEEFPNTALDCSIINNLLGPPIAACDTQTVMLNATTSGANTYEWYLDIGNGYQQIPAESGPTLQVAVSGMYRVLVIMPSGNNIVSEVQVGFSPSPNTAPVSDETVCLDGLIFDLSQKKSEALGAQSPNEFSVGFYRSYNDAINNVNILPDDFIASENLEEIFIRTASIENPNCFDVSQSFRVYGVDVPQLDFETEVYICNDSPVATIGQRVPNPDYLYSWSSGQTSSQITVTGEGTYTLFVTNEENNVNCFAERTVNVIFSSPPEVSDIEIEYLNDDNTVTVLTTSQGNLEFQIDENPTQGHPVFKNVLPGRHTIRVRDLNGCGEVTEEIVIVGFPKFFTPNGDHTNEFWNVEGLEILENPVISIYDRYGKLLYQMNENSSGWDGTLNGVPVAATDYWFKLTYTDGTGQTTTAKYINSHFSIKR